MNGLQQKDIVQLLDIEYIKFFLKQLEELLATLTGFGTNIVAYIHSAIEKINSLDSDETTLKQHLNRCKEKLSQTQDKAEFFKNRVRAFLNRVKVDETKATAIKAALQRNDKTPLELYLNTLSRNLMKCIKFYEEFQKVYKETDELCRKTLAECSSKKDKAKYRKYVARAVGGGAALTGVVGVIGGGVTLSIVAGFFTFGIGTVVGLAATTTVATGTMAVGAGAAGVAGVGSHLVAQNLNKTQQTFEAICGDLDKVSTNVLGIGMKVSRLKKLILDPVMCDKENVQEEAEIGMGTDQLCKSFDILLQGLIAVQLSSFN
jgi:hypothetical protein